ncbi:MAG: hypothetical protein NTX49_03520 [Chlamydiae bacterium]|nr:hypothetical protein [Chlamydiota bacterium]
MASIAGSPLPGRQPPVAALFFKVQGPEIFEILASHGFPDTAAHRIVNYIIGSEDPFGAKQWQRYFGVDVGLEPELPPSFYRFWNGPDPIEPEKKVYETHLPPVLRPRFLTHIATRTLHPLTLRTLDRLVAQPAVGNQTGFFRVSPLSDPLAIVEITNAGPSSWLLLRKEAVALGESYDEQKGSIEEVNAGTGAGYEAEPFAIDLVTVIFARYVGKGERHFGDETGCEGLPTFSTCKDVSTDSDHSYFESQSYPMAIGGFSSRGLHLATVRFAESRYGIACVKKF